MSYSDVCLALLWTDIQMLFGVIFKVIHCSGINLSLIQIFQRCKSLTPALENVITYFGFIKVKKKIAFTLPKRKM